MGRQTIGFLGALVVATDAARAKRATASVRTSLSEFRPFLPFRSSKKPPFHAAGKESPLRITCGARLWPLDSFWAFGRMDDHGAVDRGKGVEAIRNWRVGVLRACYDAGRLAVIGGGGGGAGGARCCASVPRLGKVTFHAAHEHLKAPKPRR